MIERYSLPEMSALWTLESRFNKVLEVEKAASLSMAEAGVIPKKSALNINKKASFKISEIKKFEKVTKHDVTAFLQSVGKSLGKDARFVHLGLTSYDVVDTGVSMQLRDGLDIILKKAHILRSELKKKSLQYKNTPAIGRTHGVHSEPISFGLKFLLYYDEMNRGIERLERAKEVISYGKLSGAVGTNASVPPSIEKSTMKKLGLKVAPVSTQVLQRDRHAEVLAALAIVAATMEKIAVEIRHLQKTEVREVEEGFTKGQTGSSAMPHKKNPVNSERITGLARIIRSNLMAALENNALWHERDISHSSVERVIFPDSFILVDFMLDETANVIRNLRVYTEQMMVNIVKTRGLVFSQRLLTALIGKGLARFDAYRIVQDLSMRVWNDPDVSLQTLVTLDKTVNKLLTEKEIKNIFNINDYLKHVGTIYKRVIKK